MFVPSAEAAKITVQLLHKYKDEGRMEDALELNYKYVTPEDFLQEHFEQHEYPLQVQDEATEFFFKILKNRKYLTMVEKEFLSEHSGSGDGKPTEASLNLVLLHLLIIEINEFSKNKILELIKSLNEKKGLLLLSLFKNPNTITRLYNLGCKIWDVEYVKEVLQNVIKGELMQEVYETATTLVKKGKNKEKKKLTVPIGPKCLSYPKKFVKPPEIFIAPPPKTRIPIRIRPTPIPSSTYVKPIQLEEIEKACRRHREEAMQKYLEAEKNAFRCANPEKSEKFKQLIKKIEMERLGVPLKRQSWSKIKLKEVQPPKKTAAVILREGARLLKIEQEEIKRYEDLAMGGFNSDQIAEWEKEIREETFRKQIEDIEKKHLEGLLSYEEALIAKQNFLKLKKEKAAEFRKEKENWLNQLETWRKEEQLRIQESVEKGKAIGKGAKEAVEHVKEEKHKIALETMEESRTLKEKWLREKEQELQRKVQLIKEIKALQALGVIRKKQTDFTETANMGFLYEMSLAELKERLFILKIEVQEELERRRNSVKMKRECRKEIIHGYEELIESHQKILQERKQRPESEITDEENINKRPVESQSLESLRWKLYQKRRERIRQQITC